MRGVHGVEQLNNAGSDLLSFCALNELNIINTCFEKKNIHKYTWQHARSKHWHCIDYIIMCQKQRRLCQVLALIHSADCWTNHKLLHTKIRVKVSHKPPACRTRHQSFDISSLRNTDVRERYNNAAIRE